ncbi:signal peptidase I [Glycocaulis sp.]|uniref:signal peptidase I n=1 Tax=Glycocaulis sp. TaxID=1969725 RepID=UPI003D22E6BC
MTDHSGQGEVRPQNMVTAFFRRVVSEFGETIRFFAGVAAVWFALVTFGFAAFHIPSESMQPALQVGDRVLVSKFTYGYSRHSLPLNMGYLLPESWSGRVLNFGGPARGEVIVVRDPRQRINIIKRVIGLPGDTIEVRGGRLIINGDVMERVEQDVIRYRTREGQVVAVTVYEEILPEGNSHIIYERTDNALLDNVGPFRVPNDSYFLMGDNRDASADSRVASQLGYVHRDNIVGRAFTVLFTFANCRNEEGLACPPWRVFRGL